MAQSYVFAREINLYLHYHIDKHEINALIFIHNVSIEGS